MRLIATIATVICALTQVPAAYAQAPSGAPPGPPPRLGEQIAEAKPDDVRVFATGAILANLDSFKAQADKAVGKHLAIEYGTARFGLRQKIIDGQAFEVAILIPEVNDELIAKGLAKPQKFEIASVPAGIGYAGNISPPDISNAAALKKTLLGAKMVNYANEGLGGLTAAKVLTGLGITDAVKHSKAPSGMGPAITLGPGEYTISIQPASEIIADKKLKYAGPVIDEYQVPNVLEAVIGAHGRDEKAAKAFIDFLHNAEFGEALKKSGMVLSK